MKKFAGEFKKFISRGNIVDMAVGVIVGSSFTAIVNALSNNILKPIINWLLAFIFKKDALSELYVILVEAKKDILDASGNPVLDEAGKVLQELDLENSIYIDFGAFIIAIINFFIIAFVLFCIVKTINSIRESSENFGKRQKKLTKSMRKELRANGIPLHNIKAVDRYITAKEAAEAEEKARAEEEALAKAEAERLAKPTTEDLLSAILEEIKKNNN